MDYINREAVRDGKRFDLKPTEFAVLEYLMQNAGRPVTRSMIVENVWSKCFEGLTNVVDVHINHLRSKIDRGFPTKLIRTAFGIGYELVEPQNTAPLSHRVEEQIEKTSGGASLREARLRQRTTWQSGEC